MPRLVRAVAVLALLALAPRARAEIQKSGPEVWPSKHMISVMTGYQQGIGDYSRLGFTGGTPSGFKLMGDYSFRFSQMFWLDFGANLIFGGSCNAFGNCGSFGYGWTVEPHAGLLLTFVIDRIPLVPYAKFDATFIGVYNRFCEDNGFAFGARGAGGAKYYLTKNIGLGAELGLVGGPAFYAGSTRCGFPGGHVEFYFAADFVVGASFVL